eukprot:UN28987
MKYKVNSREYTFKYVQRGKSKILNELNQWKLKYRESEKEHNDLREKFNMLSIEKEHSGLNTRDGFGGGADDKNLNNNKRAPQGRPKISVKTVYQNDTRRWEPPKYDCYSELLDFIKTQYDSTYIVSYVDADGDSVRLTNNSDCRRAFEVASQNRWDSLKLQIKLRAEMEISKQYSELEAKHRKLKKHFQKLKKRTDGSNYSAKGRGVLDQMLQSYSNKKTTVNDTIKDPLAGSNVRRSAYSNTNNEQSGLWSLKDTFVRNVKSDLRSGWALIQLEIDDRKSLADAATKDGFRIIRESVSKHLKTYVAKNDVGGQCLFFDLNICYMLLISNQNEQTLKPLARNILNYISEQNILREHKIGPLPGVDAITLSAGAVMYNGEEDYLRWSRKTD